MTTRADSTMAVHPLFQSGEGGSIPTSALQLFFARTSRLTFKECNLDWHSRLPKIGVSQFRAIYSAEFDGIIYAVAAWSNPVARLLPQLEWLELRRFAIHQKAPKNTASRMIGWMIRDIRKTLYNVKKLISYQDLATHKGTIYKASGWHQAEGYKSRARVWIGREGRTNQAVSPRMRWELDL